MDVVIRTARKEDAPSLHRFLEISYGHGRDFFYRHYPERYRDEDEAMGCFLIALEDGQIVSNVGLFPMEVVILGERFKCAGIGGVATHPQARGKGYMTELLNRSLSKMREEGYDFSLLWGNRQRYGAFGYEVCGAQYHLTYSRRSLDRAGVQPIPVTEVDPADPEVVALIRRLHQLLPCRVERPRLDLQLQKPGLRVFIGGDGYLISNREVSGDLSGVEVVSTEGKELELIYGAMNLTFGSRAEAFVETADSERNRRLVSACESWSLAPRTMFRIVNWPRFMAKLRPVLERLAVGLPPFSISIGCQDGARVDVVSLQWDGTQLLLGNEKGLGRYLEFSVRELSGHIFGGPPVKASLGALAALLPIPTYISRLDAI